MPLRTYTKHNHYMASGQNYDYQPREFILRQDNSNTVRSSKVTMFDVFAAMYFGLKRLVASSSAAGMIVPMALILAGGGFIFYQIAPAKFEELKIQNNYYDKGSIPLVDVGYIETPEQYISNPGADYFRKLADSAAGQAGFGEDQESLSYEGTLYITIPKLKINRMPIKANVDSGDQAIYNSILDTALAHFKGSSLPHSSTAGNIVIYGHSVGGSYRPRANDVVSAFTFLSDLQVGDSIELEMNGKKYNYRMNRSKIVAPEDVSILTGTPGRGSLTLFTCWGLNNGGPGNRSGRLVVTAVPV